MFIIRCLIKHRFHPLRCENPAYQNLETRLFLTGKLNSFVFSILGAVKQVLLFCFVLNQNGQQQPVTAVSVGAKTKSGLALLPFHHPSIHHYVTRWVWLLTGILSRGGAPPVSKYDCSFKSPTSFLGYYPLSGALHEQAFEFHDLISAGVARSSLSQMTGYFRAQMLLHVSFHLTLWT